VGHGSAKLASLISGEAVYSFRQRQQERANALSKEKRRSFFELRTAAVADLSLSDVDSIHVPIDERGVPIMAKFLFSGSYTRDGAKGLLKEGGSSRRAMLDEMIGSLGGKVEAFYFAFGEADVYVIADLPDAASAAALSMTASATGAVGVKTVALLSPEEIDEASSKSVTYRPPGA
jgi:uncharacterized protein with GYD domain